MCRCVCVSARSSLCVLTLRILYPSRFRPPAVMCLICLFFCLFVCCCFFAAIFIVCIPDFKLVCPLAFVLLQIFFTLTTLFCYPVFFSLFNAPLDVVVHFLVFLRSFRFKTFRFQFSPFVAQIKNFCSDTGFFF